MRQTAQQNKGSSKEPKKTRRLPRQHLSFCLTRITERTTALTVGYYPNPAVRRVSNQGHYAIAALTVESSASLEQFFESTGIPVPKLTGRGPTDVHTTAGSDLVLALRRKRLYMMVPDVPSSSTSKTTQSGLSLAIMARLSAQVLAVLTR